MLIKHSNTEKQGGLMFFYRNNSSDGQRTFKIPCLQPQDRYKIYSFETGKTLGTFIGKKLMEEGITVTIPSTYSDRLRRWRVLFYTVVERE